MKTNSFCFLICNLHPLSQSRFSFDLLWGGSDLSSGLCKNVTASGEREALSGVRSRWAILNADATTAVGTLGCCSVVSFLSYSNFAYKSEVYNLA